MQEFTDVQAEAVVASAEFDVRRGMAKKDVMDSFEKLRKAGSYLVER